jgi:hypothetical protein
MKPYKERCGEESRPRKSKLAQRLRRSEHKKQRALLKRTTPE